jgi:hypothetical protein
LNLGDNTKITEILYWQPMVFVTANERFSACKILDDDDVHMMFEVHGQFESLCAIELYVTFEDVHPTHQQQLINLPQTQHTPSSSHADFSQYYQLLQQNTLQFESEPSSSTYTPYSQTHNIPYTHVEGDGEGDEKEEEADSEVEGIIEDSENEEDYHDNIYNDDDNTEDDQTQPTYDPTPISAYNPPPHMRMLDLATID